MAGAAPGHLRQPVLAPVGTVQQPLEQALASLNFASNYELIRTLEPFVRGRTASYHDFVLAARNAVTTYLPDLLPHIDDILAFLVLRYGVGDAPQLARSLPRRSTTGIGQEGVGP